MPAAGVPALWVTPAPLRRACPFALNQGTIYISLVRLEARGWIKSKWGVSDNNRRARFYAITKPGEKQLAAETENWERVSAMVGRVLPPQALRFP